MLSPLSKITNPENTSQFVLVKDSNSKRVNDLLIHNTIQVTFHYKLLISRDTNTEFEVELNFSKMITNKKYNADLASFLDKKLMCDFAKKRHFDTKASGNKNTRDGTLKKLPKPTCLMISASGI